MFDLSNMSIADLQQDEQKFIALEYLSDAWQDAMTDGVAIEALANAAFFAAVSELVNRYGEDTVATMVSSLPTRIQRGEFTLNKVIQ